LRSGDDWILSLASITRTRTLCTCALIRIRRHDQLD
jgi:hypothetical protein